jgi:hypothetical protein
MKKYYNAYIPSVKRVDVKTNLFAPKTMNVLKLIKWHLWDSL